MKRRDIVIQEIGGRVPDSIKQHITTKCGRLMEEFALANGVIVKVTFSRLDLDAMEYQVKAGVLVDPHGLYFCSDHSNSLLLACENVLAKIVRHLENRELLASSPFEISRRILDALPVGVVA